MSFQDILEYTLNYPIDELSALQHNREQIEIETELLQVLQA